MDDSMQRGEEVLMQLMWISDNNSPIFNSLRHTGKLSLIQNKTFNIERNIKI